MPNLNIFFLLFTFLPTMSLLGTPGDTTIARSFWKKAAKAYNTQKLDSAQYYFAQAGSHYQEAGYEMRYADCMDLAGISAYSIRRFKDAFFLFQKALPIYIKNWGEDDLRMEIIYNNYGGILIELGRRVEGRKYLQKSLALKKHVYSEQDLSTATTLANLGVSSLYLGEFNESQNYYLRALPAYLFAYTEKHNLVADIYHNIGINLEKSGEITRAREYFIKSLNIYREVNGEDHWRLAHPYMSLGLGYDNAGKLDSAKYFYDKSLKAAQKGQLPKIVGNYYSIYASIYSEEGDFQNALISINRAINIIKDDFGADFPSLGNYYQIKAEIYHKMDNHNQAREFYQKAVNFFKKIYGEVNPSTTKVLINFSESYLDQGNLERSAELIQEAIVAFAPDYDPSDFSTNPLPTEVIDNKIFLDLLKVKAKIQKKLGENDHEQYAFALNTYQRIDEVLDFMRRGYLSEESKLFLQENSVPIYEEVIAFCIELYEQANDEDYLYQAFKYSEKSKAVVLAESLQAAEVRSLRGIPDNILQLEKDIQLKIRESEATLADIEQTDSDNLTNIKKLQLDIFNLKVSRDSLATRINEQYPDYYNLKYHVEIASLDQVQSFLGKRTSILSYFLGDKNWYVFSIGANEIKVQEIEKGSFPKEKIENFLKIISDKKSLYASQWEFSYELYEALIGRPLSNLPETEKLIFIPDGIFGHLPFDLLLTERLQEAGFDHRRLPYLIRKYSTSYAYSLTSLIQQHQFDIHNSQKYIGFAPDYPMEFMATVRDGDRQVPLGMLIGATNEVNTANDIFGGKAFIGESATEYNFKTQASDAAILHLAMHAMVDDNDPLQSKLFFTDLEDSTQDNNLNAYEIYNIRLKSQMAVLSACKTGIGEIKRGEGIMSLSRAFLYAGCPSIVTSLWQAADKPTQDIMKIFFEKINQGKPKDEALREAKLAFLDQADPLISHPANWATFVVVGDAEPVDFGTKWWIWGIGIIILSILIFLGYRIMSAKKSY